MSDSEVEPRSDAQVLEEEKPVTPPAAQATPPPAKTPVQPPSAAQPGQTGQTQVQTESPEAAQEEEMAPPPTAEEQHEQSESYIASGKKIDDMISAAGKVPQAPVELSFERTPDTIYKSALLH